MTRTSERGLNTIPPLTVLFVDDAPDDIDLERTALRRDFAVDSTRIDTPEAFVVALQSAGADVILCDYAMPRFSGMQALALWQDAGAPIPFIFVSGTLSEEIAVECIKAGATDYVLKDNLRRLPMAVERALREFAAARALRQAEAERARVAAAVEQTDEAVLITAPDGTIVYVNPAFSRMTGYRPDDAIGSTPRLLRSGKQDPAFYEAMWQKISCGEVWHGQLVNRRRDGGFYDAEVTIAPVFNAAGQIVNFSAIQRDVSERVAAEQRLREVYTQLAETDRLKDEFLAAFSHELRSPLHVIVGYADVLMENVREQLPDASMAMIEAIARSGEHLARLINETLDLARLRIDALQPRFAALDVAALVREVTTGFALRASRKSLALSCDAPRTPVEIISDQLRVRQIFFNLLDNALKFTDQGEVRVSVACDGDGVGVEVRDTGIGIAPADIPRIFEDFRQLDGSSTRRYDGCGLGLALSKRLLDLLGGRVEVESEPGRGSCFRVRLPRENPRTAE